jgi:hypothetical protein
MGKYSVTEIEELSDKQKIFKLKIEDKCPFDEFCEELEKSEKGKKDLMVIQSRLYDVAKLNYDKLPKTKFKELSRDKSDPYKDYEIKLKNYRLYFFKDKDNGQIIVFGAKKGNNKKQSRDIARMRKTKMDYFNQKQNEQEKNV